MLLLLVSIASAFEGVYTGATWRYQDDGLAPAATWATPAYDDSGWDAGPASLGFGGAGLDTTLVNHGGYTYYFRTTFDVADASSVSEALLDIEFDDGAVAYLNGTEIGRWFLPAGSVLYTTAATSSTGPARSVAGWTVPTGALVDGENVLAVEIHQGSTASSDIFLSAHLSLSPHIQVGPYLLQPASDSMLVMWESRDSSAGTVEVGTTAAYGTTFADATVDTLHEVSLTGLTADTLYHYRVTADGWPSGDYTFRTPPDTAATNLRFAVYGDSRTNPAIHRTIAQAMADADPVLIVNSGDFVDNASEEETWPVQVFAPLTAFASSIPYLTTPGNHETPYVYPTSSYWDWFPSPTGQDWWAVTVGPARFLLLDSNDPDFNGDHGDPTISAQWAWLENELATATEPYLFVVQHHPAYDSGFHAIDNDVLTFETYLAPLLESYGVTALLAGHEHRYERSVANGTQYFTLGGGGASPHPACNDGGGGQCNNEYQAAEADTYCYAIFEIEGDEVWATVYDDSSSPIEAPILLTDDPPTLTVDSPGAGCNSADDTLTVAWTVVDTDSSDTVDVYADTDGAGCDGTLLGAGYDAADGSASVVTTALTEGGWFIYAVASDSTSETCAYASGTVHVAHPSATGAPLLPLGASWTWFASGTTPAGPWKIPSYPSPGWSTGCGELGYGDGDEQTVVSATNTAYFRSSFTWAGGAPPSRLILEAAVDDGAVVYLNGVAVARINMPTGAIAYATYARSDREGTPRTVVNLPPTAPALLVAGTNVLAVEVHQSSAASGDLSWDAALFAR